MYLGKLVKENPVATSPTHYARIIKEKANRRKAIEIVQKIRVACYNNNGNTTDIINQAQRDILRN